MVNVEETTRGGRFSGNRNKCCECVGRYMWYIQETRTLATDWYRQQILTDLNGRLSFINFSCLLVICSSQWRRELQTNTPLHKKSSALIISNIIGNRCSIAYHIPGEWILEGKITHNKSLHKIFPCRLICTQNLHVIYKSVCSRCHGEFFCRLRNIQLKGVLFTIVRSGYKEYLLLTRSQTYKCLGGIIVNSYRYCNLGVQIEGKWNEK